MIISFREYGDRSLGCDGSRCLGRRWLTGLAVFVVVFESLTVLVLRAHYTMDVFTGMVTGLYAAHLANHISTSPKTTTSELPAGNVTILRVPPGDIRAAKVKSDLVLGFWAIHPIIVPPRNRNESHIRVRHGCL